MLAIKPSIKNKNNAHSAFLITWEILNKCTLISTMRSNAKYGFRLTKKPNKTALNQGFVELRYSANNGNAMKIKLPLSKASNTGVLIANIVNLSGNL